MTLSVIESDAFKRIEQVAELYLQSKSPYQIARQLNIKVVEAKEAIAQWQEIINNDMDARDAAKDHLNTMVQRYERLISEANDNLDNLKALGFDEKISAQINTTIKLIGELDAKRVDLLQKAGQIFGSDLGDELAQMQEQRDTIIQVLGTELCPECKKAVASKIMMMTGQVPSIREDKPGDVG